MNDGCYEEALAGCRGLVGQGLRLERVEGNLMSCDKYNV
jgi:hypothetical protein